MSQDWISSRYGRLVYGLAQDARPAWVWAAGADTSLWHNRAALLFGAAHGGGRTQTAQPAHPIKGQIKRLLRLGFSGVPSLARVQMLVGDHPVSQTCRCTPIVLADGEPALVCASADAIEIPGGDADVSNQPALDRLLPHLGAHALVNQDDVALSGSPAGLAAIRDGQIAQAQRHDLGDGLSVLVFSEAPQLPHTPPDPDVSDRPEETVARQESSELQEHEPELASEPAIETGRLTELMQRFDSDSGLYDPLGPEDDVLPDALVPETVTHGPVDPIPDEPLGPEDDYVDEIDLAELEVLDGVGNSEDDEFDAPGDIGVEGKSVADVEPEQNISDDAPRSVQWRVTGRGFVADADAEVAVSPAGPDEDGTDAEPEQPEEELDQAARYNFDELARILTDKVSGDPSPAPASEPASAPERRSAATLSLSDEHLVLNRLPLGILVFRDQDIVFANRAMADLLGCASIAELRERGLDAIFPRMDDPGVSPGPVATLMDSAGGQVPVSARLQAVSWHGGPALMLSARRENSSPDGEILVRNFVETLAASRGDGFVEINRAGVIEAASGRAADLLDQSDAGITGRPLAVFIAPEHMSGFRAFLEKPARRSGVDRPNISLETINGAELSLFTEGSAGIVTGYFGLLTDTSPVPANQAENAGLKAETDPALMARMSRGLRRPLNTIIGFSQLLENQAFGALGHPRYLEYARDIQAAGRDIEGLVDEFDQYDDLHDEEFLADASDFPLDDLLSECEAVVRHQASRRQVFVRSAISEHLPHIRADRTLMRQALLNLLASAIDQTPMGGKVILSSQVEDDGSVSVHVRDSGSGEAEFAERSAVFREGSSRRGEAMVPMKSSIGLALTRSLLAVNACSLTIDPSSGTGTLMSLHIPADLARARQRQVD